MANFRRFFAFIVVATIFVACSGVKKNPMVSVEPEIQQEEQVGKVAATSVMTVAKNTAMGDRAVNIPTGVVGQKNVQIGSFVLICMDGSQGYDVGSISLSTKLSKDVLGSVFRNIRIVAVGRTSTSVAAPKGSGPWVFYFPVRPGIKGAGVQMVVDVYADIISPVDQGVIQVVNDKPVVAVQSVTVIGKTNAFSVSTGLLDLQRVFISQQGSLKVGLSPASPMAQEVTPGQNGVEVARFKFSASVDEDLILSKVYVFGTTDGNFGNFRLYNGIKLVPTTTAGPGVDFSFPGLTIPRNSNIELRVVADVAASATAGYNTQFGLVQSSVVATGAWSGKVVSVLFGKSGNEAVMSNTITVASPEDNAIDYGPQWMFIWGYVAIGGKPAPVGTVVDVVDVDGNIVGVCKVSTPGGYGAMPVYLNYPEDHPEKWVVNGETLALRINGVKTSSTFTWTTFDDVIQVDISR